MINNLVGAAEKKTKKSKGCSLPLFVSIGQASIRQAASETIKELREKVKDLEAENALLKKVKALVEKREAQLLVEPFAVYG